MFVHSCYKQDYRHVFIIVYLLPCVAYAFALVVQWVCAACGVPVQSAVCLCSFALCQCSLQCACTVYNVLVQFAGCLCSLPCASAVCGRFICSVPACSLCGVRVRCGCAVGLCCLRCACAVCNVPVQTVPCACAVCSVPVQSITCLCGLQSACVCCVLVKSADGSYAVCLCCSPCANCLCNVAVLLHLVSDRLHYASVLCLRARRL